MAFSTYSTYGSSYDNTSIPRVVFEIGNEDIESAEWRDGKLVVSMKYGAGYTSTITGFVLKADTEDHDKYWKTDELRSQLEARKSKYVRMRDNAYDSKWYSNAANWHAYVLCIDSLLSDLEINEVDTP